MYSCCTTWHATKQGQKVQGLNQLQYAWNLSIPVKGNLDYAYDKCFLFDFPLDSFDMAPAACPVRGRLHSEQSAKGGEAISKVVPVLPSVVLNYTCEATEVFLFIYFTPNMEASSDLD